MIPLLRTLAADINTFTQLPWTPLYTQRLEAGKITEVGSEGSFISTWALSLITVFTISVFFFEQYLNVRQAIALKKKAVPFCLANNVANIDQERILLEEKKKRARRFHRQEEEKKCEWPMETEDDSEDNDSVDDLDTKLSEEPKLLLPIVKEKFGIHRQHESDTIYWKMAFAAFGTFLDVYFMVTGDMAGCWDISTDIGRDYFGWNEKDNEIGISLLFLFLFQIIFMFCVELPFHYYLAVHIDGKHGKSEITLISFLVTSLKAVIVQAAMQLSCAILILNSLKFFGDNYYFYVWTISVVVSIIAATIVPWVKSFSCKYKSIQEGELKRKIVSLASQVSYPLEDIYILDDSSSAPPSTTLSGFSNKKSIILTASLLREKEDEILGIIGHELGHWKLGHGLKSFIIIQIYHALGIYFFSLFHTKRDFFHAFGFDDPERPVPTVIELFLFQQTLWIPIGKILLYLKNASFHQQVLAADKFTVKLGRSTSLQKFLCKTDMETMENVRPDLMYATCTYPKPHLVERLAKMSRLEKKDK